MISSVAQTPPKQTLTQSSVDTCLSPPSSSPCNPPQQPETNQFCPPNLDQNTSVLSADEQNSLSRLLGEFSDVFTESTTELGCTDVIHHKIHVGDHPSVRQRPHRVPPGQRQTIEQHHNRHAPSGIDSAFKQPMELLSMDLLSLFKKKMDPPDFVSITIAWILLHVRIVILLLESMMHLMPSQVLAILVPWTCTVDTTKSK